MAGTTSQRWIARRQARAHFEVRCNAAGVRATDHRLATQLERDFAAEINIHANPMSAEEVAICEPYRPSFRFTKVNRLEANTAFASMEDRKVYSQHVSTGRRKGIYFENEIPYGEDRDGAQPGSLYHVAGR